MEDTKITGDKLVEGDLTIDGHLFVTGFLRVTGELIVKGFLSAGEGITAGWGITAGEDYGIYAGISLTISHQKEYGFVTAATLPNRIMVGFYKKSEPPVWAWHVHHQILAEKFTEPLENRITYIKSNKPKQEQETRLRLIKQLTKPFDKSFHPSKHDFKEQLNALHAMECPNCPWNGKTIFP